MTQRRDTRAAEIGSIVRDLRRERGWTQTELARAAGLSRGAIATLELGRYEVPTLNTLTRVAGALRVSISRLVGEPPPPESAELAAFLASDFGKTATKAEIDDLRRFPAAGSRPTARTYEIVLMALRSREEHGRT